MFINLDTVFTLYFYVIISYSNNNNIERAILLDRNSKRDLNNNREERKSVVNKGGIVNKNYSSKQELFYGLDFTSEWLQTIINQCQKGEVYIPKN